MQTYIITITEPPPDFGGETQLPPTEHYRRRVELPDVNAVIERLDAALKFKSRKPRSDAGTRKPSTT